ETLGVVGETGCGKTMTGLSILVLVPPPGRIEGGRIFFNKDGEVIDLLSQSKEFLRGIRGKDASMIFQDPRSALNPVYTVQEQISEALLRHRKKEFIERVLKHQSLTAFERKIYEKMLENPDSLTIKV
ncbi:MAG: ATP-binding cassette domain-containing protein, partial [Candidatus Bathyarchaeia archaeon]